jgi:hypothetical protein
MEIKFKAIIVAIAILIAGGNLTVRCAIPGSQGSEENSTSSVLKKSNLKVLHIGNSYTFDAVSYLPLIIDGTGADVSDLCIYRTMRAGGSFRNWYLIYNNKDFELDYQIEKVCGGIDANITTGNGSAGDGSLLRKALTDEQWDIIFIQPVSSYAPYYEQWRGYGEGGYLNELLDIIKKDQPKAAIGIMLVHSYASDFPANTEESSYKRWELITNSVERFCNDYKVDFVIPYGTAIQNLRASSLNNELDLTCDGVHCELGLGRYTASCCYFQSIIAPRTGKSVLDDKTRINAAYIHADSPVISVDDRTAPIAQKAALLAVEDWHSCSNPETSLVVGINAPSKEESNKETESIYTLSGTKISPTSAKSKKNVYIKNHRKVTY